MFLHLFATVRSTETWAPFHLVAIAIVIVVVAWLVGRLRVRRRR